MKYRTIVADPPWQVHRPPQLGSGTLVKASPRNRPLPYPTMDVDEIAALPVTDWAAENCHLYLWTINRYIEDAYRVVRNWGFVPSTLLVWCKQPFGLGPGGAYAITTEYVLFARRGSGPFEQRHPTTWWHWPRQKPASVKPDAFLDIVEQVSPGPYLEMFARHARFGWDYWGDESLGTAELAS